MRLPQHALATLAVIAAAAAALMLHPSPGRAAGFDPPGAMPLAPLRCQFSNGDIYSRVFDCQRQAHVDGGDEAHPDPFASVNWNCLTVSYSGLTAQYAVPAGVQFVRVVLTGSNDTLSFTQINPSVNVAVIGITGAGDTVALSQTGEANLAKAKSVKPSQIDITQDGTVVNAAKIRQQGNRQRGTITQHGHGTAVQRGVIVQGPRVHVDTSCTGTCGVATAAAAAPVGPAGQTGGEGKKGGRHGHGGHGHGHGGQQGAGKA